MPYRPRMGRRSVLTLPGLALPGLILAGTRPAGAATLEIAPVLVELPPARPAAVLNIVNVGDTQARLQMRPFVWSQADGRDHLEPTDLLVTSPPQFTLAPKQSQVARLALRSPPGGQIENSYRLLVDELPAPGGGSGVAMLIRVSLPVFAPPTTGLKPAAEYAALPGPPAQLLVVNRGTRRTILAELKLGGLDARTEGPGYVLAGAERRWSLPPSARLRPGTTMRLTGIRDGEAFDVAVPVRNA